MKDEYIDELLYNIKKTTVKLLKEEEDNPYNIKNKLIKFFLNADFITDNELNRFASLTHMSDGDIRNLVYSLLQDYLKVGKHRNEPDSKYDVEELKKGVLVEMEHSDNVDICKEIAKDHLSECKNYYTLLNKMELKCKEDIIK